MVRGIFRLRRAARGEIPMSDDVIETIASDLEAVARAVRSGDATVDYHTSANFQEETEIIELRIDWGGGNE